MEQTGSVGGMVEKVQQPAATFSSTVPSVRRKPIATAVNTTGIPPSQHPYAILPSPSPAAAAQQPQPPSTTLPYPATAAVNARYTRPSLLTRLRRRWTAFSKRTRILVIVALIALVILIVGLAAGLSTRKGRTSNLPLPSAHGGPYTGDLTYYDPGLGACGISSSSSENIVAVSHLLFDAVSVGSNPNANPLCGKKIRARRDGKSVDLTVVDRCVGCEARDLDVTESVFAALANVDQGRVLVEWSWLEDVPGAAG